MITQAARETWGTPKRHCAPLGYQHKTHGRPTKTHARFGAELDRAQQTDLIAQWFEEVGLNPCDSEWNRLLTRHFGGKASD
jgi:hypothetical protein